MSYFFFFFKQKTAYEFVDCDWSSDVCSSDLGLVVLADDQALHVAQSAIARQYDQALLPVERMFFYLPFEHNENLTHQNQAVAYFEALVRVAPELRSSLDYAYRHRSVIAEFGRFPHRNSILGRTSTPAELDFLAQPGSGF